MSVKNGWIEVLLCTLFSAGRIRVDSGGAGEILQRLPSDRPVRCTTLSFGFEVDLFQVTQRYFLKRDGDAVDKQKVSRSASTKLYRPNWDEE